METMRIAPATQVLEVLQRAAMVGTQLKLTKFLA